MKFGTDTDKYGNWFRLIISKNLSTVFTFKFCQLKEFNDYITLHNIWMLLTFVVTLYLMHCSYLGSGHFIISYFYLIKTIQILHSLDNNLVYSVHNTKVTQHSARNGIKSDSLGQPRLWPGVLLHNSMYKLKVWCY